MCISDFGEMAHQLEVVTTLLESLSSLPKTHIQWLRNVCVSNSRGFGHNCDTVNTTRK